MMTDPLVLHRCMQCCRLICVLQVWCSAVHGSRSLHKKQKEFYDRKHVHTKVLMIEIFHQEEVQSGSKVAWSIPHHQVSQQLKGCTC